MVELPVPTVTPKAALTCPSVRSEQGLTGAPYAIPVPQAVTMQEAPATTIDRFQSIYLTPRFLMIGFLTV